METEVNVNTNQTAEPITQPGADFETFEQLESFLDSTPKRPSESNKLSQKLEKATAEKQLEKKAKSSKGEDDLEEQGAQDENEDEKEIETKEKEVNQAKKLADEKADLKAKAAKLYKVRQGDKDLDLSSDGEIEVKINGKLEKAKIQDLISNYSGKVNWDREYSKLDTERKTFQNDLEMINSRINEAFNLAVTQKNPRGAIQYIAELMGANPRDVLKSFDEQMKTQIDEWGKLSPEEARAKQAEDEANYYRQREQKRLEEQKTQEVRKEIGSRVETVQKRYGLDNDTFLRLYNELKISGNYSDETLTPEAIGEYYQDIKTYEDVSSLVSDTKLDGEQKTQATRELWSIWRKNPDFTKEDVAEIASRVYGVKLAKNLSRKVRKAEGSAPEKTESRSKREPITFDDIDED